jgi:hypothetical protein
MSATERLHAAIEKLERLRAESTPGPWVSEVSDYNDYEFGPYQGANIRDVADEIDRTPDRGWEPALKVADAEMIVTLHRTIDAQLEILAYGATLVGRIPDGILALADAILGGAE